MAKPSKTDKGSREPGSGSLKEVRDLIELMQKHDLEEVQVEQGGLKVRLKRASAAAAYAVPHFPPQAAVPPLRPGAEPHLGPLVKPPVQDVTPAGAPAGEKLLEIRSPMVGTFYAAPSPDSPPFTGVGKTVDPETVVCIIEAMKVMNEIKAEVSGTIVKSAVQNGQAVEYNQPLFLVKPV
jgi:acetyl-CoA carboxylase biotin carboxyl carrier protein